ncbi:MAG: tryptophanase [Bdellovibrionales bacterium]|nr:tryptophanase [Bdellovibrionales bacterium]
MYKFKTLIEPFKIKSMEPIQLNSYEHRKKVLKEARLNLFLVPAKEVIIDLLTDSGTGAMSADQWAALMKGDESYSGSESFYRFQKSVQDITGMPYVLPTHQGRSAERILFHTLPLKGEYVVSNTLFDTTRANAEDLGFKVLDMPCSEFYQAQSEFGFKGNINLLSLEKVLHHKSVACVVLTITNNSAGGQPVSMENIKSTSILCKKYNVPLVLDACRFAENTYFIKTREKGYRDQSPLEISRKIFDQVDLCFVSAKKDGLAHIGGFICLRNEQWSEECKKRLLISEGFPTYGGLAGRDLEAIALGLKEALNESYLQYRISSVEYLHGNLRKIGIPLVLPAGGHAVYIDAKAALPSIPVSAYPAQSFSVGLYEFSGVRTCEIGSVMFGKELENGEPVFHNQELVRLALPRRVYTFSHLDYVCEAVEAFMKEKASSLRGVRIVHAPPVLRHFSAHFEWL